MTTNDITPIQSLPPDKQFLLVGIGASAGGVLALQQFFATIPADSGMAYAVVLHLSQAHESNLDTILQSKTKMPVLQVQEPVKVEPNHVYVIPPGKFLELVDGIVRLQEPEQTEGKRIAIDYFFRTLADAYGQRAISIVLSGTGTDGTLGMRHIKERNGFAMVQDPKDAAFDAMPRSAIDTGLVDVVLPVAQMAHKLLAVRDSTTRFHLVDDNDKKLEEEIKSSEALREIITLLRIRTGNDFSNYKQPTILRRIARHLQIHELDSLPAYLKLLRERPEEVDFLQTNLLINVTNFFRDKDAFAVLEQEVIPQLFAGKNPQDTVRVWVAGCASGEEAYSMAILLTEYAERITNAPKLQVFASDVDAEAVAEARQGRYTEAIELDVSEERLRRFFVKDAEMYRVKKEIREIILFVPHNILRDPPFSRLDLVSCRNVLIYLNRSTQEKVLQLFHFALRSGGFLFLGSSESAESSTHLFLPLDKKQRIYTCIGTGAVPYSSPFLPTERTWEIRTQEPTLVSRDPLFSFGELHVRLVEQYAPPSVLVNEDFDILHLSENAGRYLRFVGGEPSNNLLKVLHPDLRLELQATLFAAQREKNSAKVADVSVQLEGQQRFVTMQVHTMTAPESDPLQGFLLILFEEHAFVSGTETPDALKTLPQANTVAAAAIIQRMEEELQRTKSRLRNTVEQYETSGEELKASNEELQAINEELRSTSEELETSKEELQSLNEELTTVNHELKETLEEVSRTNSDLQNLMIATNIGSIFLDRNLHIKRFTPEAQKLFNIIPSDIGRPIAHLTHLLEYDALTEDANDVLKTLQTIEKEIHSVNNHWYIARFLPYRTIDDRINGVVLTFLDITQSRQAEEAMRESEEKYRNLFTSIDEGFCILEKTEGEPLDFRYIEVNPAFEVQSGVNDVVGKTIREVVPGESEEWFDIYNKVLQTGEPIRVERPLVTQGRELELYAFRMEDKIRRRVAVIFKNITERKRAEEVLQAADRKINDFLATLAHELRNPLTPIQSALKILHLSNNPAQAEQARTVIERQLRKVIVLVNDLQEISRITTGKVRLKKQQMLLSEAVLEAVETVEPLMKGAEHQFILQLPNKPIYLYADADRITQVLVNLLTNAIKYTPSGGKISLSVKKEYKQAAIRLKDNGIGIPQERLENIFDLFNQIEPLGKELQSGLGIGLNLVKTLVEVHGGKVVAYSAGKDKGSEFLVHLPLPKPDKKQLPAPAIEPILEPVASGAKEKLSRILVVDDEADITEVTQLLLEMDGYEVQTAHTGAKAIEVAASFEPEAALVDIGLPDMDGYEVGRRLRLAHPDLLLIAHSGWGAEEDFQRSQAAGFDYHLVKPAEMEEITALLNRKAS